jgi:hypothetical protein
VDTQPNTLVFVALQTIHPATKTRSAANPCVITRVSIFYVFAVPAAAASSSSSLAAYPTLQYTFIHLT